VTIAVHGDLFAGLHDHEIARDHRLDAISVSLPLAHHVRRAGAEAGEAPDRFRGTALGAGLEQPPEEDQRDDADTDS